jgi:Transposase protein
MREVRRLGDNGHQTAIVTTRHDLSIAVVAYRMVERWTQENFFRYMRQPFALDALVTDAVEPADPHRTVPNPARQALRKHLAEGRAALKALEQASGHAARANLEGQRPTMRGFKIAPGALGQQIRAQARECDEPKARIAALPERVPLQAVLDAGEIVRLAPEAKHLTDTITMVAYRAETALVRCLAPHYAKTEDEGRALIREMLSSSADIVPEGQRLRIRVHSLANPRSNQALAHVCATLNALELQYPGTTLTLMYEAP